VEEKQINFMGLRKITSTLSILMVLASLLSITFQGLPLALDFTGGTLVEVEYEQAPNLEVVRTKLESAGYKNVVVQKLSSDTAVSVRLADAFDDKIGLRIRDELATDGAVITLKRSEFVGAQVGEELREQGGLGILLALFAIMVYVSFQFQFKFSVAAVTALVHDVIITLGMFSIFRWDFDLTVLAAILAIIGYSLNDTIVVFDRVRENFRKLRKLEPIEVINVSLTQTLDRTISTSLTTVLVVISLFFFGGPAIHGFATAMMIGIVVGTYSSIYVASALTLAMGVSKEDLIREVPETEDGAETDKMP
jgi:preprotein translocase subunit SecF